MQCGKCTQTLDEVADMIEANDPTMEITRNRKTGQKSLGTLKFKCGKRRQGNTIMPINRSVLKRIECKCREGMKTF